MKGTKKKDTKKKKNVQQKNKVNLDLELTGAGGQSTLSRRGTIQLKKKS